MLPNKSHFSFSYDCKHTLDCIYSYLESGGLKLQLKEFGAENLILSDEIEKPLPATIKENEVIKKISSKDIVIAWEHYETNYLKNPTDINITDDFDDDDDDDDDEDGNINIEDMMPAGFMKIGMMNQSKEVHYTPWGKFEQDNPLSPAKLYDLQMVHFKGFKVKNISSDFKSFMSEIEGVAIWGQIDPYCIIIGPSKMYDFKQVKYNLESAIYRSLSIEEEDPTIRYIDHILNTIKQQSLTLFEDGTENLIIVFPDEYNSIEIIENYTIDDIETVDGLIAQIANLTVFINGEVYT